MILENPEKYDGFVSEEYEIIESGRDYRDTYTIVEKWQYRINIDSILSIDKRYYHGCDGIIQDEHSEWDTAWNITDIREIVNILYEIENEL